MSTKAWTNLIATKQQRILLTVRAILQSIRQLVRHGRKTAQQAYRDADFRPLISLMGIDSYHPNFAATQARSVVRAYEILFDEHARAKAEAVTATENTNTSNSPHSPHSPNSPNSPISPISPISPNSPNNPNNPDAVLPQFSCNVCALAFQSALALSAHAQHCLSECPVCFGHSGRSQSFLAKHLIQCGAIPRDECFYVCDVCRTETQNGQQIFQTHSLKEKIKHLNDYHFASNSMAITRQRYTCPCKRELKGSDFIKHRCRGPNSNMFICNCKYATPKVKKQHRWVSKAARQKHVRSGQCYQRNK
jgi:hypothetical protein